MSERILRVGLVGYGLGGRVFHAPLIAAEPRMELTAIVTRDAERSAKAHEDFPDATILGSVDDLLAAAGGLDLVVVTTTNRVHVPIGIAVLDAGLGLVMDKPLAPTSLDGSRLLERARERGLPFSVFQNRRFDGDFRTIERLLGDGRLGKVVRFESRYERWRPKPRENAWRESGEAEDAGGLLFDLGSHLIDQALHLFGRPSSVYAEIHRRREGVVVDDDTFVALTHRGGEVSHLWMNVLAAIPGPRFRVLGSKATYEKDGMDVQEAALQSGARPGDAGWGIEPESAWGRLSSGDGVEAVPTEPGAYEAYYGELAGAILDGLHLPVDPIDSIVGLEVIEAAFRSAREGRVVPFPAG